MNLALLPVAVAATCGVVAAVAYMAHTDPDKADHPVVGCLTFSFLVALTAGALVVLWVKVFVP